MLFNQCTHGRHLEGQVHTPGWFGFFSLNGYKTHHLFIFYIKTLVAQPFYKLIYKFQNTLKRVEKQKIKPNQSRILNSIYIYIYIGISSINLILSKVTLKLAFFRGWNIVHRLISLSFLFSMTLFFLLNLKD